MHPLARPQNDGLDEKLRAIGTRAYQDLHLARLEYRSEIPSQEAQLPGRNSNADALRFSRAQSDLANSLQLQNRPRDGCYLVVCKQKHRLFDSMRTFIGYVDPGLDRVFLRDTIGRDGKVCQRDTAVGQPVAERVEGIIGHVN